MLDEYEAAALDGKLRSRLEGLGDRGEGRLLGQNFSDDRFEALRTALRVNAAMTVFDTAD